MIAIFRAVSQWTVPLLILAVIMAAACKKIPVYEVFVQGALEGLKLTARLTPYILAIYVAVGLFRASGLLNYFNTILSWLGVPPDLITLGLLKPLSGSASLGLTAEILQKHGPDSMTGTMASLIQGGSETAFYVISLYLGSVGIKDGRHILLIGLLCEAFAFWMGISLSRLLIHM